MQTAHSKAKRSIVRKGVAVIACFAWACSNMVEPPLPSGAVPMARPPQYALWWQLTERCAGRSADLERITWYVGPGATSLGPSEVQGETYMPSHRIVIAGNFVDIPRLVRHEMLHAILGVPGHPAQFFQRDCAGVVVCDENCVDDGGKLPPADTTGPVVRPTDVDVSARADSAQPSMARDGGWMALTVAIHNPRPTPVRVHLASLGQGYWSAYGYNAVYCQSPDQGSAASELAVGYDSTIVVAGGESQFYAFVLQTSGVCFIMTPFLADDTLPAIRVDPRP